MSRQRKTPKLGVHKASGQACVHLDGRRVYLGVAGTPESVQAYHALLADWMAGRPPEPPRRPASSSLTVVELCARYLEHAERAYTRSNERGRYAVVSAYLDRLAGRTPAEAFGPLDLQRVREALVADGRTRTAVNRLVVAARTVFRWGASMELVPPSVPAALGMLRGLRRGELGVRESERRRPIALEMIAATLPHLPPPVAAMVRLQLLTAMRAGEVCAVRPIDVDTTGPTWWYTPEEHKNAWRGDARRVPLVKAAQEAVAPFLRRELAAPCFQPAEAAAWYAERRRAERTTPDSCGNRPGSRARGGRRDGDRYRADTYRQAVEHACRRAFPAPPEHTTRAAILAWRRAHPNEAREWDRSHRWTPALLRHTAASLIRKASGLEAARVALGHSGADVTHRHYAELQAEAAVPFLEQLATQLRIA